MRVRPLAAAAWTRWKRFAHVVGNVQGRLLLTVFYLVIVPPFALLVKLIKDPLGLRPPRGGRFWTERPPLDAPLDWGRRQY